MAVIFDFVCLFLSGDFCHSKELAERVIGTARPFVLAEILQEKPANEVYIVFTTFRTLGYALAAPSDVQFVHAGLLLHTRAECAKADLHVI